MLVLVGCKNDVDLVFQGDPVPLVYGIISPEDSIHSVRISLTKPGDASQEGLSGDSFSEALKGAEIFLELRSPAGSIIERSQLFLTQVAGRDVLPGLVYPSFVFECPGMRPVVSANRTQALYALTVSLPDIQRFVYAETCIPPEPELVLPPSLLSGQPVNLFADQGSNEIIIRLPDTISVDFTATIRYAELEQSGWTQKSVVYRRQYEAAIRSGHQQYDPFQLDEEWFFTQVAYHIERDPSIKERRFESIDLLLTYASPDIDQYRRATGFSSDFIQGSYTNVVNGLGLFVSFNQRDYKGFTLNNQSMDSLISGICTRNLGFRRNP